MMQIQVCLKIHICIDGGSNVVSNNILQFYIHCTFQIILAVPTLSNGHLIIDRHQWGAGPSKVAFVAARLLHPIPHVIVTHIGYGSKPCNNVYNCSTKMRTIQDAAIAKKGLDDMKANFYVRSRRPGPCEIRLQI